MSFKTNVRIQTNTEGFSILKDILDNVENSSIKILDYLNEDTEGEVIFGWDWVKWYSSYPIPIAFNKAFNDFEKKDIPYKIVLINEDGTVEEEGHETNQFASYLGYSLDFNIS